MLRTLALAVGLAFLSASALAADPDCGSADLIKSAALPLAACIDPAAWTKIDGSADQEFVYFSKDQKAGLALITEIPAVPMSDYHDGILAFAEKQSGAAAGSIKSYDDATVTIGGKSWGSMHYNGTVQGTEIEFLNYFYSADGFGSVQLVFWSAPADAALVTADLAPNVIATVALNP